MEATDEQIKKILWEINNMVYGEKRVYTAMEAMATNLFGKKETEEILAKSKDKAPSNTQPWEQRRLRIEELKAGIVASPDGSEVLLKDEPMDEPESSNEEKADGNVTEQATYTTGQLTFGAICCGLAIVFFVAIIFDIKLTGSNAKSLYFLGVAGALLFAKFNK